MFGVFFSHATNYWNFLIPKGINTTYRYAGRQKVEIEYEDLILLLNEEEPKTEKLSTASKTQLDNHGKKTILAYL